MKIDAAREGGSTVLRLGGRLDREWAEHLSTTLEELLRDGVRSLTLDLSSVTYVSSAATKVLTRWQQELVVACGRDATVLPAGRAGGGGGSGGGGAGGTGASATNAIIVGTLGIAPA